MSFFALLFTRMIFLLLRRTRSDRQRRFIRPFAIIRSRVSVTITGIKGDV